MFRGFRLVVSVTAALPINAEDGEAVYNFRGSVSTGHFLGQLFRTLGQVLHLDAEEQPESASGNDPHQLSNDQARHLRTSDNEVIELAVESRISGSREATKTNERFQRQLKETKATFSQQGSKQEKMLMHKKVDKLSLEKEVINKMMGAQPTCQNSSHGKCS